MPFLLTSLYLFVCLFLERGDGREKERERNVDEREKHRLVVSLMSPDWGLNLQPRLVHIE